MSTIFDAGNAKPAPDPSVLDLAGVERRLSSIWDQHPYTVFVFSRHLG